MLRAVAIATTSVVAAAGAMGTMAVKMAKPKVAPKPSLKIDIKLAAGVAAVVGAAAVAIYIRKRRPRLENVVYTADVKEESLVQGSQFSDRPIPPCQAMIGFRTGDSISVVGCGIRTEYGFWTPSHVVSSRYKEAMLVKNGKAKSLEPYIQKAVDNPFGLEMICIKIPENVYSDLGISKAQFSNLQHKDMVTIVGPDGQSTMGEMSRTEGKNFGSVTYGGSTMAGFSGAPYMKGNRVVAIHLHGGKTNGGQETLYLNQVYKVEYAPESMTPGEDTGEKIAKKAFKQNGVPEHEIYDQDVVFRDDTGHYHRLKLDTWNRLKSEYAVGRYEDDFNDKDYDTDSDDSYDRYKIDPKEYEEFWNWKNSRGRNREEDYYEDESAPVFRNKGEKQKSPPSQTSKLKDSLTKGEPVPIQRTQNMSGDLMKLLDKLIKLSETRQSSKKHIPWRPRPRTQEQHSAHSKPNSKEGPSTSKTTPPLRRRNSMQL